MNPIALNSEHTDRLLFTDLFVCVLLCNLLALSHDLNLWVFWGDATSLAAHSTLQRLAYLFLVLSTLCACLASRYFAQLILSSSVMQKSTGDLSARIKLTFWSTLILCSFSMLTLMLWSLKYIQTAWYSSLTLLIALPNFIDGLRGLVFLVLLFQLFFTPQSQISKILDSARTFYIVIGVVLPALKYLPQSHLWLGNIMQNTFGISLYEVLNALSILMLFFGLFYIIVFLYKRLQRYFVDDVQNNAVNDVEGEAKGKVETYSLRTIWFLVATMICYLIGVLLDH